MYRTQPLGLIFNEELNTYRPLYKATAIHSLPSPQKPSPRNPSVGNWTSVERGASQQPHPTQKPPIHTMQPTISPKKPIEIDARVRSPHSHQKQKVSTPKQNKHVHYQYLNKEYKDISSRVNGGNVSYQIVPNPPSLQQIREVRRRVTEYSRINKSYQQPQTQIGDSTTGAIQTLNAAIHQLLDALNPRNNPSLQHTDRQYERISKDTVDLLRALQIKNQEILSLEGLLQRERVTLACANSAIQSHQEKFRKEEEYGQESRRKLRAEIDALKAAYFQLVRRVEEETGCQNPSHNQYKELYEQSQRELEEFRRKPYKQSMETEGFTVNERRYQQ